MKSWLLGTTIAAVCATAPAFAGKTYPVGDGITVTPSLDARLRWENVTQDNALDDADALTIRLRPGLTLGVGSGFSVLVEGEGTLGLVDNYNSTTNGHTGYSTVADPDNIELNRAQIQFKSKVATFTGGRQRINLDDQRFVGSVGWRQNEQTFDAVRGEATLGPVMVDATYSWSQRTIFGVDAGPRTAFDGTYFFLGVGGALGPVKVKAFSYLLDYSPDEPVAANSSQTYGVRAAGNFKLGSKVKLDLAASYANQSDYKANPASYSVDYVALEAGLSYGNFGLTAGYELLGSDKGKAFQTPLATLHKFNGWADMFLTTPASGLQDVYIGGKANFPKLKALPGLNVAVTWHNFTSDAGSLKYGKEWDASIGFKPMKSLTILAKFADFDRTGIAKFTGDVSTRKFWLQAEFGL